MRDSGIDLENLKRKVDAGVDFLITQLFYDNECYWEFCRRARAAGIGVPIIPGIMPITNASQVTRFGATCRLSWPSNWTTDERTGNYNNWGGSCDLAVC